jgi:uncharacterized alkaline shock family protein YloU
MPAPRRLLHTPHDDGAHAPDVTGTVRIAPEVLATIVTLTATSIPGVTGMGNVPGHSILSRPRHEWTRGVRLAVRQNTVSIDLYVAVAAGINMVSTGTAVQHAVSTAVHEMLGMEVKDVNVFIQRIEG